jgi:hypothetical protein
MQGAEKFDQDLSDWKANPTSGCSSFAYGADDWIAQYGTGSKSPPLGSGMVSAGCQLIS